jgi:hypothetical protein
MSSLFAKPKTHRGEADIGQNFLHAAQLFRHGQSGEAYSGFEIEIESETL